MNCETFREELPRYLREEMDESRRADWRRHLGECGACRSLAVRREPSLLLAVAQPEPAVEAVDEARVEAVLAEVRSHRIERRLGSRRWRRMAAAAALVVAGGLGGLVLAPRHQGTPMGEEAARRTQPPAVEVEMGSEVTVYQLAAEDGDTAVAFVVNPGLRL